jgi:hypothetical protein
MKGDLTVQRISKNLGFDILNKSREKHFVYGRWIAFKVLSNMDFRLQEIADALNLSHATVIYGLNQFEPQMRYLDFKKLCDKSQCFLNEAGIAIEFCNPIKFEIR